MLGRNHAIAAAAAWVWTNHALEVLPGMTEPLSGEQVLMSAAVVAGAGVLPDLDHPGSTPTKAFGWVSGLVSRIVRVGGHRQATHSLAFAGLVTLLLWGAVNTNIWWNHPHANRVGLIAAGVFVFASTAIGVTLIGPSLGARVPTLAAWALGAAAVWWTVTAETPILAVVPHIAAVGIVTHIATDGITRAGVPLLLPLTRVRFSARLIRTGGRGEHAISALIFLVGVWGVTLLF